MNTHTTPGLNIIRTLLAPPDSVMLDYGAGGELLVARMRLWLVLLIGLIAIGAVLADPALLTETVLGILTASLVGIASCIALILARQVGRYPWLPWFTTTTDISFVTLCLILMLLESGPQGIHRQAVWMLYVVSIALTALRNDTRLSLYSGVLTLAQYLTLAGVTINAYPTSALRNPYNIISWATVGQRVLLLIIFTIITTAVVVRMHRLARLAGTDHLTGVPNRTWFFNAFPSQLQYAQQQNKPISLGIIDLDHFKQVNDTIGHAAGDAALEHVVNIIRTNLPAPHYLARLGGEEFVIVLKHPPQEALRQLDTLRQAVAQSTFIPNPGDPAYPLTFSAGLTSLPRDGSSLSELLHLADQRLYRAKEGGRNQVVSNDEE